MNFITQDDMGQWASAQAMTVGRDGRSTQSYYTIYFQQIYFTALCIVSLCTGRGLKASNVHIYTEYTWLVLHVTG